MEGLGEKLVSGLVSPASYTINKKTGQVMDFVAGESMECTLNESNISDLLITGQKIDSLFKQSSDIEFCYSNNLLYILQSRSITGN